MSRPLVFHACGAGIALLCAVLCVYSFSIDPAGQTGEILILLAVIGGMAVLYAVAVWGIVRNWWGSFAVANSAHPTNSAGNKKCVHGRNNTPVKAGAVLMWAVVFRLILLPSQPILETDYYRYLWDGYVLSQGNNPYLFAPGEILSQDAIDGLSPEQTQSLERLRSLTRRVTPAQDILSEINNPGVITIYPPFAQIVFGVSAYFFPLSLFGWRLMILFFDTALILALVALLSKFGRDPRMVIVYAWSPLVLKETINTLHFDVIATAALFLAVLFGLAGYGKRSAAAWGCGILTKIYPVFIVPLWCRKWGYKSWLTFFLVLAGLLFTFSGAGGRGASGWATFANRWESNSSVVIVLETLLGWAGIPEWGDGPTLFTISGTAFRLDAFLLAKALCFVAVLGLTAVLSWKAFRKEIEDEQRLRWTFLLVGTIILLSPVCNPWYVTWIVPFLCFYPRLSWIYLSIACFVHYTFFIPDPWGYLPGMRELEYLPFFGLLVWEFWKGNRLSGGRETKLRNYESISKYI